MPSVTETALVGSPKTKAVMTEEAAKKQLAQIRREAAKTVKALIIMEQLKSFRLKSQAESLTLLVLTSQTTGEQVLHIVPEQGDVEMDAQKLARYFDILLQEEELANSEAKELDLKHRVKLAPPGRVSIDLYISGQDMEIGKTAFGDIKRNDLKGLPYFIRTAQRVSGRLRSADAQLPTGTTVFRPLSTPEAKEAIKTAATAAIELAHMV